MRRFTRKALKSGDWRWDFKLVERAQRDARLNSRNDAVRRLLEFLSQKRILNHSDFEPLNYSGTARQLRASGLPMTRAHVSRAMKLLVQHGYLREGPRQTRNVATYMLLPAWGTGLTATESWSRH